MTGRAGAIVDNGQDVLVLGADGSKASTPLTYHPVPGRWRQLPLFCVAGRYCEALDNALAS